MKTFQDIVTELPGEELIKLAEDMRQSLNTTVANLMAPMLEKFAEEAAAQAALIPEKVVQGESDENDQKGKDAGVDQKALKAALREALYTGDVNALGTIIQTLDQQFGGEMATNAINLARTIMQEGLNSKDPATQLTPDQVAVFAKAFESFDNAMGNAPTSAQ
jgi:hypothetical protein